MLRADMRHQIRREARSKDVRQRYNQEINKEAEIPLPSARHLQGKECSLKFRLAQNELSPLVSGGDGGIRTHGPVKVQRFPRTSRPIPVSPRLSQFVLPFQRITTAGVLSYDSQFSQICPAHLHRHLHGTRFVSEVVLS